MVLNEALRPFLLCVVSRRFFCDVVVALQGRGSIDQSPITA